MRKRYLYDDVPVPRRTLYRRRKEAELAARQQDSDTESSDSSREHVAPPALHGVQEGDEFDPHRSDSDAGNSNDELRSDRGGSDKSDNDDLAHSGSASDLHNTSAEMDNVNEDVNHGDAGDNMEQGNEGNEPFQVLLNNVLCPCSGTTEGDVLLMCLALGMRHNLSWSAMVDILNFVNKLYGREVVRSSKYFLLKYFDNSKNSVVVHHFCPQCENIIGTRDLLAQDNALPVQCECGHEVQLKGPSATYFVSLKLKEEFKRLMENPEVAQQIMSHRFERKKENDDAIEDIFDGECYKKLSRPGQPLAIPENFSVTFNTDGMDLGSSSSQSAWPIFMYVNELPPILRKKHVVFGGVWVGKKQPNMRIFLRPFIDNLRDLSDNGFQWVDRNGQEKVSKVLPVLSVLDSGARYKFLNLTAFSGYYGCTFCYQKAENTVVGRRFTNVDDPAPLRTHQSMVEDMQTAHNNRNNRNAKLRVYKGCKGFTPLVLLHPHLDLGSGVIVDYMHNALLGVTRSHATLVLHTAGTPYYIGSPENIHVMDSRLLLIRPPTSITRTPRDISCMKKWKASEWRCFMLFYGLLCYDQMLDQKYLEHFAMLSSAFYILLKKSITLEELQCAEKYLLQYNYLHQKYFGKTSMTYNIHLLLHVVASVRNWGPLWGPNTFIFEGENRHLGQMNTSPGQVALQLARRYTMFSSFPSLCDKYASSNEPINFVESITGRDLKYFGRHGSTLLIGQGVSEQLTDQEVMCLAEIGINCNRVANSFNRVVSNSIRYTTRTYSEGKKNDDSWIRSRFGSRGCIEKIYEIQTQAGTELVMLFTEVNLERQPVLKSNLVTVTHLKRVVGRGRLNAVKVCDVKQQCIHFNLDTGTFLADIPYGCYGD